jgi:PAS domain S-box-containing protein
MNKLNHLHFSEDSDALEFHQKIIDALPFPIFYRNKNAVYVLCNKAYEQFIGREKDKIIGLSVYDIHPTEMADVFSRRDAEMFASPGSQVYESKFKNADGIFRDVVFNKAVITDSDGVVTGIVGSIFDVTERKKAEVKLERAKESMIISSHMLHKITAGIVIINKDFKVIDSNESFSKLMGEEIENLYETIPGLLGADLNMLVPDMIYKMMSNIMASGEKSIERDVKYQNKLLHVSVVTIYKNRVVGAVIRDMSAPMLVRDEIIKRARTIVKQNIETVQKIAFLLGENASQTEELLNSIIESYQYGDDE